MADIEIPLVKVDKTKSKYIPTQIYLSSNQAQSIANAVKSKESVTITLNRDTKNKYATVLLLTPTQVGSITKRVNKGKTYRLNLSKAQLRSLKGSGFWSALKSIGEKLLDVGEYAVQHIVKPLVQDVRDTVKSGVASGIATRISKVPTPVVLKGSGIHHKEIKFT